MHLLTASFLGGFLFQLTQASLYGESNLNHTCALRISPLTLITSLPSNKSSSKKRPYYLVPPKHTLTSRIHAAPKPSAVWSSAPNSGTLIRVMNLQDKCIQRRAGLCMDFGPTFVMGVIPSIVTWGSFGILSCWDWWREDTEMMALQSTIWPLPIPKYYDGHGERDTDSPL